MTERVFIFQNKILNLQINFKCYVVKNKYKFYIWNLAKMFLY